MRRLPYVLMPVLLLIALVLGVYLWRASDALPGLGRVVGSGTPAIGAPFTLIDQDGHRRSSADFAGRYMLIYFGYAQCPDVCPTTLALMGDALAKLGPGAERVVPIFITIDPERDTPAKLKPYMASFGPRFVGLTGDLATISKVAAAYRVYFRKHPLPGGNYGLDHSSVIYLMGPDGRFVAYWDDTAIGPDQLADELRSRL
ncbi:MAG TPA: SCO family protein [Rhizomicrobium sp.]|nr:SCO family protein [Rhizomicrobium sp.]